MDNMNIYRRDPIVFKPTEEFLKNNLYKTTLMEFRYLGNEGIQYIYHTYEKDHLSIKYLIECKNKLISSISYKKYYNDFYIMILENSWSKNEEN